MTGARTGGDGGSGLRGETWSPQGRECLVSGVYIVGMFSSQVPLTPEGWECSKSWCHLGSGKGVSTNVGQQVSTGFLDRGVGRWLRAPGLGRPRLRLTDRLERRRHDIEYLGAPDMTWPLHGSLGCPQIGKWREKRGRNCPQLRDFLGSTA